MSQVGNFAQDLTRGSKQASTDLTSTQMDPLQPPKEGKLVISLLYTRASPLGLVASAVRDLRENPELVGERFVQKWKKVPSLEEAWSQKQPAS